MNVFKATNMYIHFRLIIVTPNFGVTFVRTFDATEKLDLMTTMKKAKVNLDKDSIFFWRLFQDIFKNKMINFTGIIVAPNVAKDSIEKILCKSCLKFFLFRKHVESENSFSSWIKHHLKTKTKMESDVFVDTVTRLNGLFVLFETPQQNLDSRVEEKHSRIQSSDEKVVKHVAKVLLTPQQYEILTSVIRHRYFY